MSNDFKTSITVHHAGVLHDTQMDITDGTRRQFHVNHTMTLFLTPEQARQWADTLTAYARRADAAAERRIYDLDDPALTDPAAATECEGCS